mgnify:FL=1
MAEASRRPEPDLSGLKVLHIAPTPFFSDRGCHIRILSILRAIETRGGTNILCTYPLGRDVSGVGTHRISAVPGYENTEAGPQKGKLRADLMLLILCLRTALKEKPDLIHAHLHEGLLIGWLVRILLPWKRLVLVADLQGGLVGELNDHGFFSRRSIAPGLLRFCFRALEACLLKLPAHIFCSSGNSEQIFRIDYGTKPGRITRLDDRVDLSAYDPARVSLSVSPFPKDAFVAIYSGSLLPIKGLDVLKKLILTVTGRRHDICFLLLGYPTAEMEAFVAEHQISAQVALTGRIAFESLPGYLLLGNAGIEPKHSVSGEGSGKLLHYMAAGLALAAFPTEHNLSFAGADALATGNTPADLARRIEMLADDRALCRTAGRANRDQARAYSLEDGGETIAGIYQALGLTLGQQDARGG